MPRGFRRPSEAARCTRWPRFTLRRSDRLWRVRRSTRRRRPVARQKTCRRGKPPPATLRMATSLRRVAAASAAASPLRTRTNMCGRPTGHRAVALRRQPTTARRCTTRTWTMWARRLRLAARAADARLWACRWRSAPAAAPNPGGTLLSFVLRLSCFAFRASPAA
eukprot:6511232-Prymnesium_polylepis.1